MSLEIELQEMLQKDKEELKEVQEKLGELNDKLIELKKSIESTEYLLSHKFGIRIPDSEKELTEIKHKNLSKKRYFKDSIPNLVFEMLNESGNKPLHRSEIINKLTRKGKVVKNISSSLGRDKRFRNVGRNTFVISDEFYNNKSASSVG